MATDEFFTKLLKDLARRSIERGRANDRYIEAISRTLWPWRESRLLVVVFSLVALDYLSTYALLELSGKTHIYESGLLASWALKVGGFMGLLIVDIVVVSALLVAAFAI